jgi:hypothetical protein
VVRERVRAQMLSDEIDRLLIGPRPYVTGPHREDDALGAVAEELEVACRLGRIVARLPPVPAELEGRVQAIVGSRPVYVGRAWRPAVLGALAAALVFLAIWFVAPGGQQAWAQMMHVLLGQTRVELTPTLEASQARAVREPLRDLVAVELLIGRAPSLPKALPQGYALQEIDAVSYPDLPSWISQPFYVELCYGPEGVPPELRLRQYRLLFKEFGGISSLKVASDAVAGYEQVDLGGATGMLLTLAPDRGALHEMRTVLWERDGLLLELEADTLSREELLDIARSVR